MKFTTFLSFFVTSIGCLHTIYAHPVVLDASFDEVVEKLLAVLHVPGVSLAIIDGENITTKGYGFAQLPDVPANLDTLWYTGSTTKAFTGAAAGILVQDNKKYPKVQWSTPLSELLPGDFVLNKDYETTHITLEDALSHRSGLPRHDLAYGWNNASTIDIIKTMRDLPLSAEPRTKWQYCNLMFASVGAAIERVTGRDIEAVLTDFFWQPLGMLSTTFSLERALSLKDSHGNRRLARGYYWQGEHYVPEPHMDITPVAGAGATFSSVNDYALWVKALLESSKLNQSSPITASLFQDMTTPRSIIDIPEGLGVDFPRYSLGWILLTLDGKSLITHSGATIGHGSQVFLLPNEKFGAVTMANRDSPGNILGNLMFFQLLKRRFPDMNEHMTGQTLQQLRELFYSNDSSTRQHQGTGKSSKAQHASMTKIPLPGNLDDYTGLYGHPAYGTVNVSRNIPWSPKQVVHGSVLDSQQRPLLSQYVDDRADDLFVQPSKRMWPGAWSLSHKFLTFFKAEMYVKHGIDEQSGGTPVCVNGKGDGDRVLEFRNETVYEFLIESMASFEYGSDGKVRWLGLQPDPQLLEGDRENGGDGMVWFEKL